MFVAVARYHEIVLKRGNRSRFVAQLIDNVRRAAAGLPLGKISDRHGRVAAELADAATWPELRERLRRVFGLANFSLARRLPIVQSDGRPDLGALGEEIWRWMDGQTFASFRVQTRRADKRFPLPSPEVNAVVGALLKERSGARVDLESAELTVTIEIVPDEYLVSIEKLPGAGGLPVGTSGEVVALLSGGIDSPVAACRMMRRGCRVTFVHFHSSPYVDRTSQEKARELVRRLCAYQLDARLVLVPFGEVQRKIVLVVPPAPRVVLYRRMMVRIAGAIAARLGAEALVTGDSLAQVASQTLRNLTVVEEASPLPLFRPLIGMDKLEVVQEAQRLGTFEVSIEPGEDCCSLFVPRHPETRARLQNVHALERRLDVPGLVAEALAEAAVESYRFPDGLREPRVQTLEEALRPRPERPRREAVAVAERAEPRGERSA